MKIIKPMSLSLLHKTYTFKGRHNLVVTPLCFFRLGKATTESSILTEMPQWPIIHKHLDATELLDIGMPKQRGEVLLAGQAYAPEGEPVKAMQVALSIGAVNKTLNIIGNRTWRSGLTPLQQVTEPQPFVSMPISWQQSYGGKQHPENPLGKGYLGAKKYWFGKSLSTELPNVVGAENNNVDVRSAHPPVSFRPVSLTAASRRKMAGTYDQNWQEKHFPGYAPDMDWRIFNCAPSDQQFDGFWQGSQAYCIKGMHPEYPLLEGQLPDIRGRVFIDMKNSHFSEIPVVADTIWLFPEALLGVVLFRAQTTILDSDGLDVASIMLAYENNSDVPRSLSHYQNVLALRTDPKTAMAHAFNESQLTPYKNAQQLELEAKEQAQAEAHQLAAQKQFKQSLITKLHLPEGLDSSDRTLQQLPVIAPEAIARGDFDLSDFINKAEQLAQQVQQQGQQQLSELADKQQLAQQQAEAVQSEQQRQLQARLLEEQQVQDMKNALFAQPAKFADGSASSADKVTGEQHKLPYDQASTQPCAEIPDPNSARRYALQADNKYANLPVEVTTEQRKQVLHLMTQQRSLAGRDIAGADLRGIDFSECDLTEVMFEHADLRGCNFSHADLSGAVLTGAHLDGCNFEHANLSDANLSDTLARQAIFYAAIFNKTLLIDAVLQSCDFNRSVWTAVIANQINCNHSDFSHASLERCVLLKAQLMDTDFNNALISESLLLEANLSYGRWERVCINRSALIKSTGQLLNLRHATLQTVQIGTLSDFAKADFSGASIKQCGLRQMDLRGVNVSDATFRQCDLGESDLRDAKVVDTKIIESVLSGANLSSSEYINVNFYQSLGRKAVADESRFEHCNFLQMDWQQAHWRGCELNHNQNLNQTALEISR